MTTIDEVFVIFKELIQTETALDKDLADELVESFQDYARVLTQLQSEQKEKNQIAEGSQPESSSANLRYRSSAEATLNKFIRLCLEDVYVKIGKEHPSLVQKLAQYAGSKATNLPSVTPSSLADSHLDANTLSEVQAEESRLAKKKSEAELNISTAPQGGSFFTEQIRKSQGKRNLRGLKNFFLSMLPIATWLPKYSLKNDLLGDVLAAFTVGLMLIPQGMAYALLAHIPPIYGLYAGTVPMFLYTFFGTSSELSIGPAAMLSLAIPSAVEGLGLEDGSPEFIELIIFLSFVIGLILLIAGLLRFGFVIENLFSTPILNGFTQGAAILIIMSQAKHLFKLHVPSAALSLPQIVAFIIEDFHEIHWVTFACGVVSMIFIDLMRRVSSKIPAALIMLSLSTFICYVMDVSRYGILIIGEIPPGFPKPMIVQTDLNHMLSVIRPTIVLAIIGFIETISTGKMFAARKHYTLNTSQEMIALGLSNIGGAFFQSYPVGVSLARTAVNFQTGSRTPLNQLFASSIIAIVLVAVTKVFRFTPYFVLGAIVIKGAIGLLSPSEPKHLWRLKEKGDLIELILTFLATVMMGPIIGVVFAIALAVLEFVYRAATPYVGFEAKFPGTRLFKDVTMYDNLERTPGILIARFDSRLAFYNCSHFKEQVYAKELDEPHPVHTLIIDGGGISYVDGTGIHMLEDVVADYQQKKNIRIMFADLQHPVLNSFKYSGLDKTIGSENIFPTVHEAVEAAIALEAKEVEKRAKEEEEKTQKEAQESDANGENVVQLDEVAPAETGSPSRNLRKSADLRKSGESPFSTRKSGDKPTLEHKRSFRDSLRASAIIDKFRELNPEVDLWKGEKIDAWV